MMDKSSSVALCETCLFCKIIAGQIPCYRLAEDDQAIAFLDIGPLSQGHCLVIPKTHAVTLLDLTAETLAGCMAMVHRVAGALMKTVAAPGWNLLQNNGPVAGQVVGHVHFHLIPRWPDDGLGYRWTPGELDGAAAAKLIEAMKGHLTD